MEEKIYLGIDPGTIKFGYGIIKEDSNQNSVLGFGVVKLPENLRMTEKNQFIFHTIKKMICDFSIHELAVEMQFVGKNAHSALVLNGSLAVIMLAATELSIPVYSYQPGEIKSSATGRGNSTKEQMQAMVQKRFGLDSLPKEDAADALALALCHMQRRKSPLSLKTAL
jgi:crossover junction endodeoxyribonuclease RuvC